MKEATKIVANSEQGLNLAAKALLLIDRRGDYTHWKHDFIRDDNYNKILNPQ